MKTKDSTAVRVQRTNHTATTSDGWPLGCSVFAPDEPNQSPCPVVLISAAAAVPQEFYAGYATWLVENGAQAVITYDYRGINRSSGDRSRWPSTTMKDWARIDFDHMVSWVDERFPGCELVGQGHSFGGQALGLSAHSARFTRYATVATMSGYWRGTREPYSIWIKTQIIGRLLGKIFGEIPKWAGFGVAMPEKVFNEWASWVRKPDYFFSDPSLPETSRYAETKTPLLSVRIEDDTWGTERAVDLLIRHYTSNALHHAVVVPEPGDEIGHLGYFRRKNEKYWHICGHYLLNGQLPDGVSER